MLRMLPRRLVLCLTVLLVFLLASSALAHRVNVFAYVEGDAIHVECSYSRSARVRFGDVAVKNAATGHVYLTGKTDEQGNFVFSIPSEARAEKADLNILLRAGEGHQNDWTVKAEEYLAATSGPVTTPAVLPDSKQLASTSKDAPQPAPQVMSGLEPAALQALIETAVEKKIAPVRNILLEEKERGPGMQEIVGGIGYLVGIAGLLAYARSRKKG